MSNVSLKQIYLSIQNLKQLPIIVLRELEKNFSTQIFIDDNLYNELSKNSKKYCFWDERVYGGFQYNDGIENAFLFYSSKETLEFIVQMNFVNSCEGFRQITYFATKGIRYTHFLTGMENILVIRAI